MTPVIATNKSTTATVTLKQDVDPVSNADRITIQKGKDTHYYLIVNDALDEDQKSYYRSKFAGTTTVATHAFPVGPVTSKSVTIGNQTFTVAVPTATTYTLFVQDIPKGSAGLKPVAPTAVKNVPTGPTSASFYTNFTNNVLSSSDGRFFASLPAYSATNPAPLAVSYVSNGGYVDLYNGVLYDTNGISLGYCLNLDDWLAVLNQVSVSVMSVPGATAAAPATLVLQYRDSTAVSLETAQLEEDEEANKKLTAFAATIPSISGADASTPPAVTPNATT